MLDNYEVDGFGVIHQIDVTPIKYDKQYISYYEDLSDRTIKLGYQRLGWVLGITGEIPGSVLEIGYGTGTFIEAAKITGVADCARMWGIALAGSASCARSPMISGTGIFAISLSGGDTS